MIGASPSARSLKAHSTAFVMPSAAFSTTTALWPGKKTLRFHSSRKFSAIPLHLVGAQMEQPKLVFPAWADESQNGFFEQRRDAQWICAVDQQPRLGRIGLAAIARNIPWTELQRLQLPSKTVICSTIL